MVQEAEITDKPFYRNNILENMFQYNGKFGYTKEVVVG